METVEVNTMEIDGKEFFEVDILSNNSNRYGYYAEINNPKNIRVYKVVNDGDEEYLEDVNSNELVEAFRLFNVKYN